MSDRDKHLSWHKTRKHPTKPGTIWRAWAPALNPDDTLPPYYRIEQIGSNQPVRDVSLITCRACEGGPERIKIDISDNLAEAKAAAQRDYAKRMSQLIDNA